MCERKPGPRCNDKCKLRDSKLNELNKVLAAYGKNSIEYKKVAAELLVAQDIYDTTPKGIEELSNKLTKEYSPAHSVRFLKGKITRSMQHEALKEIELGRTNAIASIVSNFENYFTTEEIESIIQSNREYREGFILSEIKEDALQNVNSHQELDSIYKKNTQNSGEDYFLYLDKVKESIELTLSGEKREEALKQVSELELMTPPSKDNLHVYRSMGYALQRSKTQLSNELSRIAAMQDTTPDVVAEYFDAYKALYVTKYSHLGVELQPNPPKDWIEGEKNNVGFVNSKSSNFIPRTNETLFAIYKMRTDLESIPDHLKLSTKITSVDFLEGNFVTTQVSRSGKFISKKTHKSEEELTATIVKDIKDSVILMPSVPSEIYEKSKNKHRFISLSDMSKKHLDIFDSSPEVLSHLLKTEPTTLSIYSGIRKRMLKTWATKNVRSASERLAFNPKGESKTLLLVR